MTLEEYQAAILLASLRVAAQPLRGLEWLERTVTLALEHGATSGHMGSLTERTLATRVRLLGEQIRFDETTKTFSTEPRQWHVLPKPPVLPDRPLTGSPRKRAGGRRHDAHTVAAQALLAPRVQIAPSDNDDMREFAEDAGRALLRIAQEVKALQRKYRKIALGGAK